MKEYVTGSSGFVGRHLTERLDNFVAIPHEKIQTFKYKPFKKFFFLSSYGNMATHTEDDLIIKANVSDLIHVVTNTNWENGIESFVYISTSSVTRKVQTMYSRVKKASEEILLSFMEKYNAPICIIRPFSITGVGEQKEHLIPKLIDSCLNGTPMPFDPDPVHDFIDVEDMVNGILTLSGKHTKGIFELGTGQGYSNQLVKQIVEKVTGKKANVHIVKNLRSYDSVDWVSRNFSARQHGWQPIKSLEQSIKEMVYEQS